MVLVVLFHPEAIAQPGEKVGKNKAQPVIGLIALKNLSVSCFVSDKSILRTHDSKQPRGQKAHQNPGAMALCCNAHKRRTGPKAASD